MRVCFVCSGNICRSPTAEVVLRAMAERAGVDVEVESAGIGGWHAGDDMDRRSRAELVTRGYDVHRHAARQLRAEDLARLDVVVAMDASHRDDLLALARDDDERARVVLLGELGEHHRDDPEVPDPYYGGADGFADVLERVEDGCRGLLARAERA